jgi:hypothetical protein
MTPFESSATSMLSKSSTLLPPLDTFFRSEWTDEQFTKYYDLIMGGPFAGYENTYEYKSNPPPPAPPIIERAVDSWVGSIPQTDLHCGGSTDRGQSAANHDAISQLIRHPDQIELHCLRPLWTGQYKWSQVWEGTISARTGRVGRSPGESFPVVVKLYQESFWGPERWEKAIGGETDENGAFTSYPRGHVTGRTHANREAWAYRRLAQLQGGYFLTGFSCQYANEGYASNRITCSMVVWIR